jgi:hypothetical protein
MLKTLNNIRKRLISVSVVLCDLRIRELRKHGKLDPVIKAINDIEMIRIQVDELVKTIRN